MDDLRVLLEGARREAHEQLEEVADLDGLEQARIRIFGRRSQLSRARGSLRDLDEAGRRSAGQIINSVHDELQARFEERKEALERAAREERWETERIDVTLPGAAFELGNLHPLTKTMWEIVDIFTGLGYRVVEGPEVELATYNFDALNTPPAHPARSLQDTYYIAGTGEPVLLRTQTSPMQIRVMEKQPPPVYIVVPGRVYRREDIDATHLCQFTQLEGLAVDEGITMGDLKGSLEVFAHEIFGRDLDVRFRPHYFPFTEPSAELDVQCFKCRGKDPNCRVCRGEGWIEVLGCGMVDPFLFEWVGYDPERYTGFAFGMGIERIAALAHGVNDIRAFYENDVRFLSQFGTVT